jgi:histidyl-tRNA synthetase
MAQAAEPPSGTRDFLADDVRRRKAAFDRVSAVFEHFGFDPLETPAFERLDVFAGKLGDEASALIFKILKRGVHEAGGEADLALRYDHTVPLARVVGTYGSRLPSPYKRYAIGNVWRADRAAKGRFREFAQCDIDTVGSSSPLADAEVVWAVNAGLEALVSATSDSWSTPGRRSTGCSRHTASRPSWARRYSARWTSWTRRPRTR